MKQLLQDLSSGKTHIIDAPTPEVLPGTILINTTLSLISVGTERMVVDFGKAGILGKARQQPEKVKLVIEKLKNDGIMTTIGAVRSKLSQPIPLGYSNVGVVYKVGHGVKGIKAGDRVVSNGRHSEVVRVPENLCARIPDNVDDESAAFTIVSSIGLQGIRLAHPELGERFVVIGVGLIGLLTVQMLIAHGCKVMAIDIDEKKLDLAKMFGAQVCCIGKGEDPIAACSAFSRGIGVDGVLICAATKSNDPIKQAARMSRKRGRIILVGVTGLEMNRADFYEKELTFQVSCSYGAGRYDPEYEEKGQDYPIGYVRWTEKRNFETVLDMLSEKKIGVQSLITHNFNFEDAATAYEMINTEKKVLGVLLDYKSNFKTRHDKCVNFKKGIKFDAKKPVLCFIGAGNYASRVLIPAFKKHGAQLHTLISSGGTSGAYHGFKKGFMQASVDIESALKDKIINTVIIVTRHNTHAELVVKAIRSGKNVFVEKPLAITEEDLKSVINAYRKANNTLSAPMLMVGFNRRFSKLTRKVKSLLENVNEPKSFIMTMNAGAIQAEHWTQDIEIGGGRIIGEACHYIDLMRFLSGSKIISVQARRIGNVNGLTNTEDNASITLGFEDGSFGTIHYFANGNKSFPKERIEIFSAGRILKIDNFRKLKAYGWPRFKKISLLRQDKGQIECPAVFLNAIEKGGADPIPINEIFEVTSVSLEVAKQLREQ